MTGCPVPLVMLVDEAAGMSPDGPDLGPDGGEPALELRHEQQVGELGLRDVGERLVGPPLPREVVEVDVAAAPVLAGAGHDHPVPDPRQQQVGQGEVAEVVRREVGLDPVRR